MVVAAVDLFCGVGGLTAGLREAGINVRGGVDIDGACKWPYENNNPGAKFIEDSIVNVRGDDLAALFPEGAIRVLAGCAPCQPFSTYSLGKAKDEDRWSMLKEFARLVRELKPEIVTMENVPRLRLHPVFSEFCSALSSEGYQFEATLVSCVEYGIPQNRKRLVLVASRLGPIRIRKHDPSKDSRHTVRDAIGAMEKLSAGETGTKDFLHRTSKLSDTNLRRIRSSIPGGSWRDWEEDIVADCHRSKSGESFPSVYGRMEWDKPAPTITTQFYGFGNGRFGHPEQDRALSLREGAILQTFPKRYRFVAPGESVNFKTVGRMIGNAVPPKLGQVIGESILAHVASYEGLPLTKKDSTEGRPHQP
jgi:DNA (cytosine-5)-methyltransferase 1